MIRDRSQASDIQCVFKTLGGIPNITYNEFLNLSYSQVSHAGQTIGQTPNLHVLLDLVRILPNVVLAKMCRIRI